MRKAPEDMGIRELADRSRGGDVTRPTSWCLKDRQGEFEPVYRPLLSDIRDILMRRL